MELTGLAWACLDLPRTAWTCLGLPGPAWVCLGLHGPDRACLDLPGLPGPDAADALGLAITHAHAGTAMAKLAQASGLGGKIGGNYRAGRSR